MNSKTCVRCNKEKEFNLFHRAFRNKDGYTSYCKDCVKEYAVKNQQSIKKSKSLWYEKRRIQNLEQNKDKRKKRALEAPLKAEITRNKRLQRQKLYRLKNKEKIRKIDKEYRETHRSQRNIMDKARKNRDLCYRLSSNLRIRLRKAIENNQKVGSAIEDLGCSIDFLKTYLESLFQPGMTWDNYGKGAGKWQIDHIEALCLFDLTDKEQFLRASHYTNLQPIYHENHIMKTAQDIIKKKGLFNYEKSRL